MLWPAPEDARARIGSGASPHIAMCRRRRVLIRGGHRSPRGQVFAAGRFGRRSHHSPRALRNLLNARRAIAAGAWSGIAKTELTLISHKT